MKKLIAFNDFISLGVIRDLELLASKNNCVLWIRNNEYDEQLYVSNTYQSLWKKTCISLYQKPQSWSASTDSQDAKTLYNTLTANRKLICQNYTAIYHVPIAGGKKRWFQDRSFHLSVNTEEKNIIAGCALYIPNKRTLQFNQDEINLKLDNIITAYYKILMSTCVLMPSDTLKQKRNILNVLSKREKQIFQLFIQGKTIMQASKALQLSSRTVEGYLNNLKNKLQCDNKSELIMKALENGILLINFE